MAIRPGGILMKRLGLRDSCKRMVVFSWRNRTRKSEKWRMIRPVGGNLGLMFLFMLRGLAELAPPAGVTTLSGMTTLSGAELRDAVNPRGHIMKMASGRGT